MPKKDATSTIPTAPVAPPPAPPPPKTTKAPDGPDVYAHVQTPGITGKKIGITGQAVTTAPVGSKLKPQGPEQPEPAKPEDEALIARAETKTKELENKLAGLQHELQTKTASETRILELQKQLSEVLSERQKMQTEISAMKARLEKSQAPPPLPPKTATYATPDENKPTVKVITPETAVRAGLPRLTTFPNVVTGIIKDNENNLLPGVLVTVRDKEDVPVRALKTNKLGQFAASTPLTNGTYFIEVEDPRNRYVFDRIQITINGNIVPAIEVVAKSQKELSREKLQKEIFGGREI
jgi:regulator of replication initiation timing